MNNYELLYIIDNGIEEEAREAVITKISAIVTDAGGKIDTIDKWGAKKLAYPINYKTEGFYVLMNFSSNSEIPAEIERVMKITDSVMRFMILKK
ncbi:MAG TPA: 30S ribosomal protein S6 [Eubacteriales bacterium]|nr:30S ribosomal protein S6 [Eubacteriales bacterium]